MIPKRTFRYAWAALALICIFLQTPAVLRAMQPPPQVVNQEFPTTDPWSVADAAAEIQMIFVRLPLAAVLGTALALRPRRRSQGARKVVVVQTQIMLAVVGAVIMLVVGNSLARAFGIVGAAGLIRYRSNIADPKDAVVMLCALAAGLASGVALYRLAIVATLFMMLLLWLIEFLEPPARKRFELKLQTANAEEFRARAEDVLKGMHLEAELLVEEEDEIRYSVSAPIDVRTKDVSDTLRLVAGGGLVVKWEEKRPDR